MHLLDPTQRATAGEPLELSFDSKRRIFKYKFRHDPLAKSRTEIFVPRVQYPEDYRVQVSDGEWESDSHNQLVHYHTHWTGIAMPFACFLANAADVQNFYDTR